MRKVIVGSRGSRLALIQTESVVTRIKEANPDLEIQITTIITAGDRDRHTPLDRIGVAVFVKELEEALLDEEEHPAVREPDRILRIRTVLDRR